jgi:hypothetical protein
MSRLNLRTSRVQSSFKTLDKRLSIVIRRINTEAAAQMKAGNYDMAKGLMDVGRSFSEFTAKTDEMSKAWDELSSNATAQLIDLGLSVGPSQKKAMSAKALSIIALQILVKRSGRAEMADVLSHLENDQVDWTEADVALVNGSARWHLTLEKAYHRSQRLGWLAKRNDGTWDITDKGRAAVEDHRAN